MKKNYLYYGTEENFFEVEKHQINNITSDANAFLGDVVENENERSKIVQNLTNEFNKQNFAYCETTNEQGYDVFIGVAKEGYCRKIRSLMEEKRRMCKEMGGF